MKRTIFLLVVVSMVLSFTSCKSDSENLVWAPMIDFTAAKSMAKSISVSPTDGALYI